MRILSILSLISASFATAASSNVITEKTDVQLEGSCYSSSTFEDKLGNKCTWYAEEKDLRCPYAELFEKNGVGAQDECCACGGGAKDDYSGTYFIQNTNNGRYLFSNGYSITTTSNRNYSGGQVQIVPTGDNQWALRFVVQNKYLSFRSNGTVGPVDEIFQRATFDIIGIVSVVSSGGSAFLNSVTNTYLNVSPSGSVGEVDDVFASGTYGVFALIKLSEDEQEE
jgi:hypothetical protein